MVLRPPESAKSGVEGGDLPEFVGAVAEENYPEIAAEHGDANNAAEEGAVIDVVRLACGESGDA